MPEVPQELREIVFIGGRPEFLPGAKPQQYLESLHTHSAFRGEEGFTLKAWYTYALTALERDGVLVDNKGGTMLLGSYKPAEIFTRRRLMPHIGWQRLVPKVEESLKLTVGAMPTKFRDYGESLGVRTAVTLT